METHDPFSSGLIRSSLSRFPTRQLQLIQDAWNTNPNIGKCKPHAHQLIISRPGSPIQVPLSALSLPGRLDPLLRLIATASAFPAFQHQNGRILLQFEDQSPEQGNVLRLDAPANASSPFHGVVPDPYCLASRCFMLFRQQLYKQPLPHWRDRNSLITWRGATTGTKVLTVSRLSDNPRYRICKRLSRLGFRADAKINRVVQARDEEACNSIRQHLVSNGLYSNALSPYSMSLSRWILDVDGNVNSWGLLWKLFSGSCVIRVSSTRGQWFHHRLIPFQHYIPVREDLSDLEQVADYCFSNEAHCQYVALNAVRMARRIMDEILLDIFSAFSCYAQKVSVL